MGAVNSFPERHANPVAGKCDFGTHLSTKAFLLADEPISHSAAGPLAALAALLRYPILLAGPGAGTIHAVRAQTDPAGMWQLEDGKCQVQVLPLAGTWHGKVVALGPEVPSKTPATPTPPAAPAT